MTNRDKAFMGICVAGLVMIIAIRNSNHEATDSKPTAASAVTPISKWDTDDRKMDALFGSRRFMERRLLH